MPDLTCVECGNALTGRQTRYCCRKCAKRCHKRKAFREGKAWARSVTYVEVTTHRCYNCGQSFEGRAWRTDRDHQHRYCSPECFAEAVGWRKRTRECPLPWVSCIGCRHRYIARPYGRTGCKRPAPCPQCNPPRKRSIKVPSPWYRRYCSECGCAFATQQPMQISCGTKCSRRRQRARRRATKREAYREDVHRQEVYERDGYRCQLCQEPVDMTAIVPAHLAPTLDHIVPLACGGEHSTDNVQLAHFICNCRKSDARHLHQETRGVPGTRIGRHQIGRAHV